MDVVVRPLRPGEEVAFVRSERIPFLEPSSEDGDDTADDERWAAKLEVDRAWIGEADGRFVANANIYSMNLTLPAPPGQAAPVTAMAGVSGVGVHPTHRRRGLLRQLMGHMLDDARKRREIVAGLLASESVIYGRFGFGHATDAQALRIDTRESAFAVPAPELPIRLVGKAEAAGLLPDLFERHRRSRPGEPNRSERVWADIFDDRRSDRQGGSAAFTAVCDGGYVRYRAKGSETDAELFVRELCGLTPDIEAALFRFVCDVDLVRSVTLQLRPVDDPLAWRLADPRQLRVTETFDRLYVRILDVPAALESRGYLRSDRLVLDVLAPADTLDGQADPAPGRWLLEAGPDGASCRPARTGEDADLRLRLTDLGSLYLGGFAASTLAAAGLVEELRPGSLDQADALFATRPAPSTGTGF
jgi:predicted acetyltransferase